MARILVIDDDDQMRKMLSEALKLQGHEIMSASNGRAGLELYQAHKADVVVTDIIMPEMDGIESILELRQDLPELKIIAISGGSQYVGPMDYLVSAKTLGAQRILTKPFELEELFQVIRELLEE